MSQRLTVSSCCLALPAALITLAVGCTPAPSGTPAPVADAGAETRPDTSGPGIDTGVDLQPPPSLSDAGQSQDAPPSDASGGDAPKPWPPPGTDYLTKIETEAQYNQLAGTISDVEFIIRRRGNDQAYPYPWDQYECVFERYRAPEPNQPANVVGHFQFLLSMDSSRAVGLYYGNAKSVGGNLIPGRLTLDKTKTPNVVRVGIENTTGLDPRNTDYPLDATVGQQIRERIMRCVPLASSFLFQVVCPGGSPFNCPLP